MELHELRPPEGARTRKRRVGRGTGSGRGKTSGRGQKGQLARSQGFRLGFEGGQLPLAQRLPKLGGFKNPFKKVYAVVNLSKLNRFQDGVTVEAKDFYEAGLVRTGMDVKLLGAGTLRRKLTITAHAASESARAAVEANGGKLTLLDVGLPTPGSADPAPPIEVPPAPSLPLEGGGTPKEGRSTRARGRRSRDVASAEE